MSVSSRLAQEEDQILTQIRLSLNMLGTVQGKRGAAYASAPITSGIRLYREARRESFTNTDEFRRAMPERFKKKVFQPNLRDGEEFGALLNRTYPRVIVPGLFFAKGWAQEHYMSLWRQVIMRHARTVALAAGWQYSLGCTEEAVIAIQYSKCVLGFRGEPASYRDVLDAIRRAVDDVDDMGFDPKRHYELWRLGTLTLESRVRVPKTA